MSIALALLLGAVAGPLGCAAWRGAVLYQSGSEALRAGEVQVAIHDLEEAADWMPEASEVQNHLGLAYAAAGRPDDALRAFRRAEALDCTNHAATLNRQRTELALSGAADPGPPEVTQ
ncbi:MAG: tetratricopeptide repeat protein [Myxococcota bacterium]